MTGRARSLSSTLFAGLLAGVVGCSSSPSIGQASSPDQAHVAQQAHEPRSGDATASQAAAEPAAAARTNATPAPTPATTTPAEPAPAAASGASRSGAKASADEPDERSAPRRIGARHVLVQWWGCDRAGKNVMRSREQAETLIQEVQRRAKAGEDLARLANEFSDEPNAGARGGSLGKFGRGQMVPAFETAAFKLRVGEISDIVETPFGFHIIQRTE